MFIQYFIVSKNLFIFYYSTLLPFCQFSFSMILSNDATGIYGKWMALDFLNNKTDNNYINVSNLGRIHETGYDESLQYIYSIIIIQSKLISVYFPCKK